MIWYKSAKRFCIFFFYIRHLTHPLKGGENYSIHCWSMAIIKLSSNFQCWSTGIKAHFFSSLSNRANEFWIFYLLLLKFIADILGLLYAVDILFLVLLNYLSLKFDYWSYSIILLSLCIFIFHYDLTKFTVSLLIY